MLWKQKRQIVDYHSCSAGSRLKLPWTASTRTGSQRWKSVFYSLISFKSIHYCEIVPPLDHTYRTPQHHCDHSLRFVPVWPSHRNSPLIVFNSQNIKTIIMIHMIKGSAGDGININININIKTIIIIHMIKGSAGDGPPKQQPDQAARPHRAVWTAWNQVRRGSILPCFTLFGFEDTFFFSMIFLLSLF